MQLVALFWKAADATSESLFSKFMEDIKAVTLPTYEFRIAEDAKFWAAHKFGKKRYGHFTSNIAESLSSV